jgi:hypothetical protein
LVLREDGMAPVTRVPFRCQSLQTML